MNFRESERYMAWASVYWMAEHIPLTQHISEIVRDPQDFLTWWFYLLCALSILCAFGLLYWHKVKQLRKEHALTAALQESERRFRAIVQNAPLGVGIVDSEGNLVGCNQALVNMVGYRQDELLQLNFADFTHPDDLEREWALIQAMWAQQAHAYTMEKRYIRKDQTVIWVKVVATVVKENGEVNFGFAFVEDITERKSMEAALKQEREKAQTYLDIAGVMILALDSAGNVTLVNQKGCALLGYAKQDIVGKNWFQCFIPERVRSEAVSIFGALMAGNVEPVEYVEDIVLTSNSEERIIAWHNTVLTDDTGHIIGTLSSGEDITERRQAEEALRQSERELQLTLEATTDGIWKWNFETNSLFFSSRYYTMLGYAPDEFPATYENWRDLIHPEDRKHALAVASTYLATKPDLYENEFRLRTKQGKYRWVHSYAKVVERRDTGEAVRMIGNHVDITKRKQAAEALRRMNERFALATHAAHLGVWDWDIQKNELTWDDRMYELYGVQRENFAGAYEAWLSGVHPDDRTTSNALSEQARRGEREYDTEFRIVRPDGTTRWLQAYAQVIWDEDGKAVRMTGVNYDITERKQAEVKLKASLAEKEVLLRELYHRTKNTLQIIQSMLLLQADRIPENHQVQQLVHDTENRIMTISLIHQKLYQSQDLSHLNISEYVQELADLLLQSFYTPSQNISLVFDIEDLPMLFDTAIPCGLIINELLSNALKHAFPDGREGEIKIRLSRKEEGQLELLIADNGVGVPPDFDFRSQSTFGLPTVIAIVEHQMQGTIRFTGYDGVHCIIEFPDTLYTQRI